MKIFDPRDVISEKQLLGRNLTKGDATVNMIHSRSVIF